MKNFTQKTLVLATLLLSTYAGFGQQQKIDSLQRLIDRGVGLEKYEPLVAMMRLHFKAGKNREALEVAKRANRLAYNAGDTLKIIESSRMKGQLFSMLEMFDEAENSIRNIVPIANKRQESR